MSFFFKKKKKNKGEEKEKEEKKGKIKKEVGKEEKEERIRQAPKEKDSETKKKEVEKKERIIRTWGILKFPHITEKASDLAKENQYVFKVFKKANKIQVKKSVEDLYGVDVLDVKIINVPRKKRMIGRISGWRKGYKKAIVKIKKGQKIEIMPR